MGLTILAAIFVFGLLVLFHEFGHFIMAKLTGMRVDEFAIGFGPKIVSKKYGETEYSLRAIPLGGFTDIAGMDPDDNEAGERGYSAKSFWKKFLVIVAGSTMNFILPIFIFFGIFFFIGVQIPSNEPIIGDVMPDKPAHMAGLMKGDLITSIDGKEIKTWDDFSTTIGESQGKVYSVTFIRGDKELKTTLIPVYDAQINKSIVGVIASLNTEEVGFFTSIWLALKKTVFILYQMLVAVFSMLLGATSAEIAGPLGVAQLAGEAAKIGFATLLNFAAILSLNLGLINLFPVPALDGGHLATLIIERLRGKPLSKKALYNAQKVGFALLVVLMLFATKNDIVRIFFPN